MFRQSNLRPSSLVGEVSILRCILVFGVVCFTTTVSQGQVILIPDNAFRRVSADAEAEVRGDGASNSANESLGPTDPGVLTAGLSTGMITASFRDVEEPFGSGTATSLAQQGVSYDFVQGLEVSRIFGSMFTSARIIGELRDLNSDASARFNQAFRVESATPFTLTGSASVTGNSEVAFGFNFGNMNFGVLADSATRADSVLAEGVLSPGTYSLGGSVGSEASIGGITNSSANVAYDLSFGEALNRIRWDTGDGSFEFNSNWDPQAVPGSDDTAIFEVPAAYTVNVGSQEVNRLHIGGGPSAETTFTNTDLTVQNSSLANPGVVVDSGNFILADGTLTSVHSVIGESTRTSATVESGATWNHQASLTAGQGGETTLSIERGGVQRAPTMTIGNDPSGNAQTDVFVNGGLLNVGSFLVGEKSTGQLFVLDGGEVTVDSHDFPNADDFDFILNQMSIGNERGESGQRVNTSGRVVVSGVDNSGVRSSLSFVGANLQILGDSELAIEDGGEAVVTESLAIGIESGDSKVTVRGINNFGGEPIRSSLEVNDLVSEVFGDRSGEIVVGVFGEGSAELNIVEGGVVESTRGHIGNAAGIQGRGVANVVGAPNIPSEWLVDEQLIVSGSNGTELNVTDGALVKINIDDERDSDISLVIGGNPSGSDALQSGFGKVTVARGSAIGVGSQTTVQVGVDGTGLLVLDDGQLQFLNRLEIGDENQSTIGGAEDSGAVIVRGSIARIILDDFPLEETDNQIIVSTGGQLTVTDGAQVVARDIVVSGAAGVVAEPSAPGLQIVGTDSVVFVNREVIVGEPTRGGAGVATVAGGGFLTIRNDENDPVFLTVGEGQVVDFESGTIVVGNAPDGTIFFPGELFIGENGVLRGSGTLVAPNGIDAQGGVNNFAGTVLPGQSPGVLTIDGNFMQGELGTTVLEIGGMLPGLEHDQIVVTGDATIDGTIQIDFIDGFAPSEGDSFNLFAVGGETLIIGSTIGIEGLQDGFEFDFGLNDDGGVSFMALNDGIFMGDGGGDTDPSNGAVPEPSAILIWIGLGCCLGFAKWKRKPAIDLPPSD